MSLARLLRGSVVSAHFCSNGPRFSPQTARSVCARCVPTRLTLVMRGASLERFARVERDFMADGSLYTASVFSGLGSHGLVVVYPNPGSPAIGSLPLSVVFFGSTLGALVARAVFQPEGSLGFVAGFISIGSLPWHAVATDFAYQITVRSDLTRCSAFKARQELPRGSTPPARSASARGSSFEAHSYRARVPEHWFTRYKRGVSLFGALVSCAVVRGADSLASHVVYWDFGLAPPCRGVLHDGLTRLGRGIHRHWLTRIPRGDLEHRCTRVMRGIRS